MSATSWVSPGIRYLLAMSLTWRVTSWRSRWAARRRCSSVRASRCAVTASSGNFASTTNGGCSGRKITQSGRVLLESVNWNAKLPLGNPSCTIASMRAWPKAPRTCLLERTSRSEVTWEESSVRFFCALSMSARRSCRCCRRSTVCLVVASMDWPMRPDTASSRSLTMRARSDWRAARPSPMAWTRPTVSTCTRAMSARRASRSSARSAASPASRERARALRATTMTNTSSAMMRTAASAPSAMPTLIGVSATMNKVSPIGHF